MEETISAITTPLGEGAVGIVRLSGPQSLAIAQKLFKSKRPLTKDNPRFLTYGHCENAQGELLDEVLAVYMPGPHSYTGEDVVEIQCHGGVEALKAILSATYEQGAIPAEPGESRSHGRESGPCATAGAVSVPHWQPRAAERRQRSPSSAPQCRALHRPDRPTRRRGSQSTV